MPSCARSPQVTQRAAWRAMQTKGRPSCACLRTFGNAAEVLPRTAKVHRSQQQKSKTFERGPSQSYPDTVPSAAVGFSVGADVAAIVVGTVGVTVVVVVVVVVEVVVVVVVVVQGSKGLRSIG